jgi:hypothetical protein
MSDPTGSNRHIFPTESDLAPQQIRDAQRVVAGNALDTPDCRRLLDMLGLLPNREGGTRWLN